MFPILCGGIADCGEEEIDQREEDQGGKDEDAGVFGDDGEGCNDCAECKTGSGGLVAVAVEGVDGGEEEACEGHVRGDDGSVGEQVGLKGEEKEREDSGEWAEDFFGREEDKQAEGEAEESNDETATHKDGVCVGGVEKLRTVYEVLAFEEWDGDGWRLAETHGKEGESGQQFSERRMLWISAEVGVLPVLEASEEMS